MKHRSTTTQNKRSKINHYLLQEQLPNVQAVGTPITKVPPKNNGKSTSMLSTTTTSSSSSSTSALLSSSSSTAGGTSHSTRDYLSAASSLGNVRYIAASDHVSELSLEMCRCTHLQEYFPHILDLELCRAVHSRRGWVMANPVHALHLQSSQIEESTPSSTHLKQQPPLLYGDEQQRTNALQTEGIVEYWCPLDGYSAVIHDDTALEKMEHLPTLHAIHGTSSTTSTTAASGPSSYSLSGPSSVVAIATASNTRTSKSKSKNSKPVTASTTIIKPTKPSVVSSNITPPVLLNLAPKITDPVSPSVTTTPGIDPAVAPNLTPSSSLQQQLAPPPPTSSSSTTSVAVTDAVVLPVEATGDANTDTKETDTGTVTPPTESSAGNMVHNTIAPTTEVTISSSPAKTTDPSKNTVDRVTSATPDETNLAIKVRPSEALPNADKDGVVDTSEVIPSGQISSENNSVPASTGTIADADDDGNKNVPAANEMSSTGPNDLDLSTLMTDSSVHVPESERKDDTSAEKGSNPKTADDGIEEDGEKEASTPNPVAPSSGNNENKNEDHDPTISGDVVVGEGDATTDIKSDDVIAVGDNVVSADVDDTASATKTFTPGPTKDTTITEPVTSTTIVNSSGDKKEGTNDGDTLSKEEGQGGETEGGRNEMEAQNKLDIDEKAGSDASLPQEEEESNLATPMTVGVSNNPESDIDPQRIAYETTVAELSSSGAMYDEKNLESTKDDDDKNDKAESRPKGISDVDSTSSKGEIDKTNAGKEDPSVDVPQSSELPMVGDSNDRVDEKVNNQDEAISQIDKDDRPGDNETKVASERNPDTLTSEYEAMEVDSTITKDPTPSSMEVQHGGGNESKASTSSDAVVDDPIPVKSDSNVVAESSSSLVNEDNKTMDVEGSFKNQDDAMNKEKSPDTIKSGVEASGDGDVPMVSTSDQQANSMATALATAATPSSTTASATPATSLNEAAVDSIRPSGMSAAPRVNFSDATSCAIGGKSSDVSAKGAIKDKIATAPVTPASAQTVPPFLAIQTEVDPHMKHLRLEEDRIRLIRRSLSLKRSPKRQDPPKETNKKKRKRDSDVYKTNGIPGWRASAPKELNNQQEHEWKEASRDATETVERWMDQYRMCQESFWDEKERHAAQSGRQRHTFYLGDHTTTEMRCCQWCAAEEAKQVRCRKVPTKQRRKFSGDQLMQCLQCSFVACSPPSLAPGSQSHMAQHLLISGHKFAVSCGVKAEIFCFQCGDCVYHEVFEKERIRIECSKRFPFLGWKQHPVLRSFDAFQFIKTEDHGIVWRGLIGTYPTIVPKEHFFAAQLTMRRHALFDGRVEEKWILPNQNAMSLAATQNLKPKQERHKIIAPVGMYNLGNTCFMSAILQCLIVCSPLQQYFLRDVGHHHTSCEIYRRKEIAATQSLATKTTKKANTPGAKGSKKNDAEVCLACEMDRLFVSYFGSTIGKDILTSFDEVSRELLGMRNPIVVPSSDIDTVTRNERGEPLIISDLLTAAWKSAGMKHLAGYDQHDAHEFLDAFLELLGKDIVKYRERVFASLTKVDADSALVPKPDKKETDVVKKMFEGSLRSVLLCEECGVKRLQHEPFMNVSLSLSEEVERMQRGKGRRVIDISLESCLNHFILPENLGDLVYCTSCARRTSTKKQHTFSKLPKILCLHLKRFDAARNKKIENFVSFPSHGLNMGSMLSHWCEVTRMQSAGYEDQDNLPVADLEILYDLFGVVNHIGSMQSGHYVANVKVEDKWYHCNDQHVSHASEESVLKADGAYILFYVRR